MSNRVAKTWHVGLITVNEEQVKQAYRNGLTRVLVASRIRAGQTVEKAINQPLKKQNPKYKTIDVIEAQANGIGYQTFMDRIHRGWETEDAKTRPVEERKKYLRGGEIDQVASVGIRVKDKKGEKTEMSKFVEYLIKNEQHAYLIEDGTQSGKTKDDYIVDAEEGVIVAFRLNFESRAGTKLTKVISGKILENNKEDEIYVIETRNSLKYGVPYSSVSWVKTGSRWPKGVYEEMKRGATEITEGEVVFGELEEIKVIDADGAEDDDFKI